MAVSLLREGKMGKKEDEKTRKGEDGRMSRDMPWHVTAVSTKTSSRKLRRDMPWHVSIAGRKSIIW